MTLIVGYADSEIGFLVGDTLLSFPVEQFNPRNPLLEKFHALKVQILTPDVAVAFAGDVGFSLSVLRQLKEELIVTPRLNVPQRLLEIVGPLQRNSDFLVLLITAEKTKKLFRVAEGCIDVVQRAYIGDSNEYVNFRNLMTSYAGPQIRCCQNSDGSWFYLTVTEGEKEFDLVSDAMERLTHQRRSETVGAICGCVTRVVDARISGKLEYMQSVEASVSPAEGHGGFSLLAANVGAVRGIGLYYRGWQAGLIFITGDLNNCHKLVAATIGEFIELARSNYGLILEGGTW